MNTYISLLRGINVGGHSQIKMKDLTGLYESSGFKNVKTYVQSGNVVFDSSMDDGEKIVKKIEKNIKTKFGFDVKLIIRTPDELNKIIKTNPFLKRAEVDKERLYMVFLSEKPDASLMKNLDIKKAPEEEFQIINKEIYLYLPKGFGTAKLQVGVFEKKLKIPATARNWKTVNALAEMVK